MRSASAEDMGQRGEGNREDIESARCIERGRKRGGERIGERLSCHVRGTSEHDGPWNRVSLYSPAAAPRINTAARKRLCTRTSNVSPRKTAFPRAN